VKKTLIAQTLHYFSRPHERIRRDPITGQSAWRGSEMQTRTDWRVELDRAAIDEIERALGFARRTGRPLGELGKGDFPLSSLGPRIREFRREIEDGRGFVLLSGLPVERFDPKDSEIVFWCLGQHLGIPGAQNPAGELLGHVRDTGARRDDPSVRLYRTSANIAYHCDAADVVGLLCLKKAKHGGTSRIVSSASVYNEILARRPDLVDVLYRPFLLDTHGEGRTKCVPIRPCRHAEGKLRTFYHSDYFRSVYEHVKVPGPTPEQRELLELYDSIAASDELALGMDFEPGDVQLLSNHSILHARTEYEDHAEPERKRHLLRLWLSLPTRRSARHRLLKGLSTLAIVESLLRIAVREKLAVI
jgi:hypothetical protein